MAKTLTNGDGSVFTVEDSEAKMLMRLGVQEASSEDLRVDRLKTQYSSAWYAPESAALGVAEGLLPGGLSGVARGLDYVSPGAGSDMMDFAQGVEAAHPWANKAGFGAGMLAGGVAMKGLSAAKTAVAGGALAAGMTADKLALDHIQTPEGSEKMAMTLGLSFVLGGVFTAGAGALGKWAGGGGLAEKGAELEARGLAMRESGSIINNPGVQEALGEKASGVADLAHEYGLLDKAPKVVKAELKAIETSATKTMNEIKAVSTNVLPAEVTNNFAADIGPLLEQDAPDLFKWATSEGGTSTIDSLHQLKIAIGNIANFNELGNPYNARLKQAYDLVGKHIKDTLQANEGLSDTSVNLVQRWEKANADYGAVRTLKGALQYSTPTEGSTLARLGAKIQGVGAGSAGYGIIGGNPGAVVGGGAAWLGGKALSAAGQAGAGGSIVSGLGKLLHKTDQYIVQTAVANLARTGTSVASVPASVAAQMVGLKDYDKAAASIQWVNENPTRAVPAMAQQLEKKGIPGQVVDSVVPQQIRNVQYLNSVRPQNPWVGKTIAPNPWKPSLGKQAAFVDQVNAVNNPVWALHNATPERIAAVKATYPLLYEKFASMVVQEASQRPELGLHARRWASAVTGLPANPGSGAAMASARMTYDHQRQVAQQQQKQAGGGGGGKPIIDSGSQLSRMSGP